MPYVTTATISGLSRSDGTTGRTITLVRVGNVTDGFILRESGVPAKLAQTFTYRSKEEKVKGGKIVRRISTVCQWPIEDPAVPGEVIGYANYGPSGLVFPIDIPDNAKKDIRKQISEFGNAVGGSYGYQCLYDPLVNGNPAF